MHTRSVAAWQHDHAFHGSHHRRNERRTWIVIVLTATMMVAEIAAGAAFGSMALLADGFHMATHAGALTIAAFAYVYARRHARDPSFTFGTGKVGDLAGFSSALILAMFALLIAYESLGRLVAPVEIHFDEAILVAVLGLAVNLGSAWLLHDEGHHHHHGHEHHHHGHHAGGQDHNLRAAYFHVLADALTSLGAIVGLLVGRFYGWIWMDPLMGIVGSIVIARWSWQLMRDTGAVLLDVVPDETLRQAILERIEVDGDRISDLHLWRVGPSHMAAILSVVSDHPQPADAYKKRLGGLPALSHVTVEVQACPDHSRAV